MCRFSRPTIFAGMGVLSVLLLPLILMAQGRDTLDFRGRSYSVEDLEKALFPEQPRARGLEPQRPVSPPPHTEPVILNVFFEFNSDKILSQYYTDLDKLGDVLTRRAEYRFEIEGHTDSTGTDDYNQVLSERRAASVKQYLVQKFSLAPQRLLVKGYGENKPIATNNTEEGRGKNRRVGVMNLGQ
jgi:OOP family OmpA-OmpF porin